LKRTLAALSCTAALVASLAACGSADDKPTLPLHPSGSTPSTAAANQPTTAPPTATTTTKPAALPAHSTYEYDGLTMVVNVPANTPSASRPSMQSFSAFLQGVSRTTAQNQLDPALSNLGSVSVVKFVKGFVDPGSIQGIGELIFTIRYIHYAPDGTTRVTGCVDQSTLLQVRKDGSRFVAASTSKYPRSKMLATISPGKSVPIVTRLAFTAGTC
jgi:hypothetical protein